MLLTVNLCHFSLSKSVCFNVAELSLLYTCVFFVDATVNGHIFFHNASYKMKLGNDTDHRGEIIPL